MDIEKKNGTVQICTSKLSVALHLYVKFLKVWIVCQLSLPPRDILDFVDHCSIAITNRIGRASHAIEGCGKRSPKSAFMFTGPHVTF